MKFHYFEAFLWYTEFQNNCNDWHSKLSRTPDQSCDCGAVVKQLNKLYSL